MAGGNCHGAPRPPDKKIPTAEGRLPLLSAFASQSNERESTGEPKRYPQNYPPDPIVTHSRTTSDGLSVCGPTCLWLILFVWMLYPPYFCKRSCLSFHPQSHFCRTAPPPRDFVGCKNSATLPG